MSYNNQNNNNNNNGPKRLFQFESFFKENGNEITTLGYNKNSGRACISTHVKNGQGFDWQNPKSIGTYPAGQALEIAQMIRTTVKSKQASVSVAMTKNGQINTHITPNNGFVDIVFEMVENGQPGNKVLIFAIQNNQELLSVLGLFSALPTYIASRLAMENHPSGNSTGGSYGGSNNNWNNNSGGNGGSNNKPSYYGNNQQQPQQQNNQQPQQQNNQQQAPQNEIDDGDIF